MKNQRIFEFDEFEKNSNRNLFNSGYNFIIGTDEAGRGPGAGGVYAAAVCFLNKNLSEILPELNDSKKLTEKKREELFPIIKENSIYSIKMVDVDVIEKINILNASLFAMKMAVEEVIQQLKDDTTATKESFTLPNIDNYWISFNARADSLNTNEVANIKVSVTIGDETKTVMELATLKGVTGTGTQHVSGDGWQCFGFPISQYFEDYKNKSCQISIEVLASSDVGIRLDQVTVTERSIDPSIDLSGVDIYNNTFDENTEDWMLGEQYATTATILTVCFLLLLRRV